MFGRHFYRSQNICKMNLKPFYYAGFNADSEYVFSFFLSCLEVEKFKLKVFQIKLFKMLHTNTYIISSSSEPN